MTGYIKCPSKVPTESWHEHHQSEDEIKEMVYFVWCLDHHMKLNFECDTQWKEASTVYHIFVGLVPGLLYQINDRQDCRDEHLQSEDTVTLLISSKLHYCMSRAIRLLQSTTTGSPSIREAEL